MYFTLKLNISWNHVTDQSTAYTLHALSLTLLTEIVFSEMNHPSFGLKRTWILLGKSKTCLNMDHVNVTTPIVSH